LQIASFRKGLNFAKKGGSGKEAKEGGSSEEQWWKPFGRQVFLSETSDFEKFAHNLGFFFR